MEVRINSGWGADNYEGEGPWPETGKADMLTAPVVNSPPEFDDGATNTLSVGENALPGSAVGGPITASDSDQRDRSVYSKVILVRQTPFASGRLVIVVWPADLRVPLSVKLLNNF